MRETIVAYVGTERRRTPRYYVSVAVEFSGGRGKTRDVSESGICLETGQRFEQGERTSFQLVFREFSGEPPWRIAAAGQVIRVEEQAAGYVVAIKITTYGLAVA